MNNINYEKNNKERVVYLDILKIISMLAVVFVHISAQNYYLVEPQSFEWKVFNIYDSFARFSVPVFVMISGCLFLDNKKELTMKKLYFHNILRIITAYIFWAILYAIEPLIFGQEISLKDTLVRIIEGSYHMWFMFMIVGLYIVTPILRKIVEDKKVTEYFLITALIFTIIIPEILGLLHITKLSQTYSKLNITITLGYSCYFILGYYLSKKELKKKNEILIYLLGILGFIATAVISQIITNKTGKAYGHYSYFYTGVMLEAIAVFILVKNIASKIKLNEKMKNIIYNISRNSFGVYLSHILVMEILQARGISTILFNPIFSVPIISVLVFIISNIISEIIHHIPILKK